jgi:hypothetical protein
MKRLFSVVFCLFVFVLSNAGALHCSENLAIQNEAGFIEIEPITFYFHFGSYFILGVTFLDWIYSRPGLVYGTAFMLRINGAKTSLCLSFLTVVPGVPRVQAS